MEYRRPRQRWCGVGSLRLALGAIVIVGVAGLVAPLDAKRAKPLADVITKDGTVTINWSRGLLTATAGASADLRAPTAKIARVKAERNARELATKKLVEAAGRLKLASKTVSFAFAHSHRLTKTLTPEAIILETEYGSDGSMVVTMGLPLESIRRGIVGPSEPPSAEGPGALVIDARAVKLQPLLALKLEAGGEQYLGPVLYRRGRRAKLVAKSFKDGVLELDASASSAVVKARNAGSVVIVLVK